MNFAVLPPEVNSARIFAGAGLGPMLAAASAWDGLAEELHAAAGSFASVTTGLAGDAWHGPASLAMTRAASPYVGWLNTAAGQAAQAAGQARLAASAFEATLAATVSPAMVAANRTRLASLVAANLLGQNAPAIAAAEAEYEQIWAQDVAAMFGYHSAASAVATQLAPIQEGLQQQLQTCWPSWLAGTWAAEMWASATSATTTLATQTSASKSRRRQHRHREYRRQKPRHWEHRQLEYRHRHHRQRTNRLRQACQPRRLGGGQRRPG